MSNNEIHQYDAVTTFVVKILQEDGTPYPVNDAQLMDFIFQKPDGTVITRPASFPDAGNGSDGVVQYTTDNTDLDQEGIWRYQVYIEKAAVAKHSSIGTFRVYPNLPLE